eukprot:1160532-Pelagomonas_calceolata.AAC.17
MMLAAADKLLKGAMDEKVDMWRNNICRETRDIEDDFGHQILTKGTPRKRVEVPFKDSATQEDSKAAGSS